MSCMLAANFSDFLKKDTTLLKLLPDEKRTLTGLWDMLSNNSWSNVLLTVKVLWDQQNSLNQLLIKSSLQWFSLNLDCCVTWLCLRHFVSWFNRLLFLILCHHLTALKLITVSVTDRNNDDKPLFCAFKFVKENSDCSLFLFSEKQCWLAVLVSITNHNIHKCFNWHFLEVLRMQHSAWGCSCSMNWCASIVLDDNLVCLLACAICS